MATLLVMGTGLAACAATYKVAIDKPGGLYRCDETAVFTVTLLSTEGLSADGSPCMRLDNFGTSVLTNMPFDVTATGVAFTVSGTLHEPGFLRLSLPPTKDGGKDPFVFSVGFDPEKIRKGSPSPVDFDNFWASAKARLAREVPLDPQVVYVPECSTSDFDFYRVSFATFGRRVHGYMSVPTDKSEAPFPVDFGVSPAGFGEHTNCMKGEKDSIRVQFSVYPFPPDWKWQESGLEAAYKAMDAEVQSKYGSPRYCQAGITESREDYFFYPVILGIDRAVDWVAARPDVDRSRFHYVGTSQGGGFGFYLCGLNRAFTRAVFYMPAITDTMGYLKGRDSGWPKIVENNSSTSERRAAAEKWAPYFDGANFASRITCPVRVAVGFSDTTCPPCAVYAAYNEIKVKDKAIGNGVGMTHACSGRFYSEFGHWAKSSGTENGATLVANGVVVGGKVCRETERRDFADGWAVRYVLPNGERLVGREDTVWTLPLDAKAWYQKSGMDYEKPYAASFVRDIPVGSVVNFPVTAKLADGTYRMITEANVVDWTDSAAEYLGGGRFAVRYVNDPKGFSQTGASTTPWRVMLVAKDLQTLATSDIVRRLCPAPLPEVAAKCAEFVKRGRCIWHWLAAGVPLYAEQKEWYDKTKELGFEYYLIDDGWRDWRDGDMDQWACLRKWIDYGKSIGVGTFVWVNSKEMPDAAKRRAYLGKVKEAGAVGIKIDFFPPPSYAQMARYEEILADTLELGLMTDFHGTVKPTGREKTWPHEVAREAVRGHEWHVSSYGRVLPQSHDCILPFNRLVQGHADYTPMVFEPGELVHFTWARELAQGIIFSAPFLCFGDNPKNYLANPAVELIKVVPCAYDEVLVLPGSEIGECAAFAKRNGKDWFIAIENGAEGRRMTIALDFLGGGKYELLGFADADDRLDGYRIDRRAVDRDGKIDLALRPCGGYCARIARVE